MAFSSYFPIICALLISSCSANDTTSPVTSEPTETTIIDQTFTQTEILTATLKQTTSSPGYTSSTNTVTAESAETIVPDQTSPSHSVTSEPIETSAASDSTNPTDKVTPEPAETTTIQETTAQADTLTSTPKQTTSSPEYTSSTNTVTAEPAETTSVPDQTSPTHSVTSEPIETSAATDPTNPTDKVTSESAETTFVPDQTSPTHSVTSEPIETSVATDSTNPTDKVTPEPAETTTIQETTAQTDTLTSTPKQTTSSPEYTSSTNTVTAESAETTSVPDQTSPTHSVTSEPIETSGTPKQTTQTSTLPTQLTETTSPFQSTTDTTDTESTSAKATTEPHETTVALKPTSPAVSVTSEPIQTTLSTEATSTATKLPTNPATTPPVQPSTTITATPVICQNGGSPNGSSCLCPPTFNGDFCQYVDNVIQPDELDQAVVVNVVIDQEYNEDYEDDTTPKYKELVGNFTMRMKAYYLGIGVPCKEVVVTDVSPGGNKMRLSAEAMAIYTTPRENGISITHEVILEIPNNASSEQIYAADLDTIRDALNDLQNCTVGSSESSADCPYNIIGDPTVDGTEVDLKGFCKKLWGDSDLAQYFTVYNNSGIIKCVSQCEKEHEQFKGCNGHGTCRLYSGTGPLCECNEMDSTWYLGEECALPIEKIAFFAGLSVTLACLLVTVAGLTAYVLINKRNQTKKKDIKEKLVNEWLNEDMEWSRANSPQNTFNAGDYKNPSFTHEESGIRRDDLRDYKRPIPLHQLSQPSSYNSTKPLRLLMSTRPMPQTAHRQETAFSNARYLQSPTPAQPHDDFSRNQPMRISRPQIRKSWDA